MQNEGLCRGIKLWQAAHSCGGQGKARGSLPRRASLLAPHLPQFPPARCFPCPRVIAPGTGTAAVLSGQCPPATRPGHDATGVTPQLLLGHRWHRGAGTALGTGCPCERSWWSLRVVCKLPRLFPVLLRTLAPGFSSVLPRSCHARQEGGPCSCCGLVSPVKSHLPLSVVSQQSCKQAAFGGTEQALGGSVLPLAAGRRGLGSGLQGKLLGRSRSTAVCQAGGKPLRSPVGNSEDKILQTQILSRISDSYSVLTRLPSL